MYKNHKMIKLNTSIEADIIEATVSFNLSIGIKKLHKHYDVKLVNIAGKGKNFRRVILKGTIENLGKLNEAAKNYKSAE